MAEQYCDYLIIGGGLAGASAIEGIRERDPEGSITLLSAEKHLPYDRPPLTKKLWFGKAQVQDIFLHDQNFYDENQVRTLTNRRVVAVDTAARAVTDDQGERYRFGKLLLATGGTPRRLDIPGHDLPGVYYYRTLDDYEQLRSQAEEGKSVVVIGGGFIGSEIAAALAINKLKVTLVYPSAYLCQRVFPKDLGLAIEDKYRGNGVRILKGQKPTAIRREGSRLVVTTDAGASVESDIVVVGAGITPAVELAEGAGLVVNDGIVVNEYLQTSHADVYAAGDNARFPYHALGRETRIEHWDHAANQGKHAGRNMAGAHEPFNYMSYFFSDLFDFGYEAVGEISSELETVAQWEKRYETGVVYYLREGKIRGAMMCNVWDKVDEARALIRAGADAAARVV